jgi:hypothetical protein
MTDDIQHNDVALLHLEEEVHKLWVPIEPTTEAEKIVAAINALNRSVDKRLEKLVDTLLLLIRVLERR